MPTRKTEEECARMVAHLQVHTEAPYKIIGYMPEGFRDVNRELVHTPPEIAEKEFDTLKDVLRAFREFKPVDTWAIVTMSKGMKPDGAKIEKAASFIGTDVLEKALKYWERMGQQNNG